MTFAFRDYQGGFNYDVQASWQVVTAVLGVMPTGAGKTVCFTALMHEHNGASAAVVHRKEIVGQISEALARLGVKHRVIAPEKVQTRIRRRHLKKFGRSYVDPQARSGVISVQTLTSKSSERNEALQRWLNQVSLVVYDEGHHYVQQGLWARAVDVMHRAKKLFVTATPERADGLGLGAHADGFAEVLVEGPTQQHLIDEGYLCPYEYRSPESDLDVAGVAVTASGDLNTKALRARVIESHIVGDVVTHYHKYAPGRRAIVFATDVETSKEIAAEFRRRGVTAEALSGDTDAGVRDRTLDAYEAGDVQVLVNVDLFDEGFDVPATDAVIMARPTLSLAKFLQMIGRGLRVIYADGFDLKTAEGRKAAIAASSKPRAIIIDAVRNWERHGPPNAPRKWSLDARPKGSRSASDLIPQRSCLGCSMPYERFYPACPNCGEVPEPPERRTIEQVDGDLMALDLEAMAALFAKSKHANMSVEEFQVDQLKRRVPEVGRSAELRRHLAAQYRRKVLRELIAWWVGMQPADRPMSEKYRRFYHRFGGVDMLSADSLTESETDALIERIKEKFTEDLV